MAWIGGQLWAEKTANGDVPEYATIAGSEDHVKSGATSGKESVEKIDLGTIFSSKDDDLMRELGGTFNGAETATRSTVEKRAVR